MRLRAPLVAFGGEAIDNYGVIREFPGLSMMTGLIGNALGWARGDFDRLDRLQARLVMGTRIDESGEAMTDFQTAQLAADDTGWTTQGRAESRRGGEDSYRSPHLRFRQYRARLDALVALRVEPADEEPTLDAIARALDRPMRPLFIGRKPCLPMTRLVAGIVEADDILDALRRRAPAPAASCEESRYQWPNGEGAFDRARAVDICDERNWKSGVHGGWRSVFEARGPFVAAVSCVSSHPEGSA
nr:type I-E CRISPR-associated protein Cas5/CasD [Candidatus Burkholderia verschuerenii]